MRAAAAGRGTLASERLSGSYLLLPCRPAEFLSIDGELIMSKRVSIFLILMGALAIGFGSIGCSSDDDTDPIVAPYPDSALVSQKVSTPPAENATVDALWDAVPTLKFSTVVAEYDIDVDGHDIWWDEYEGMVIDVEMKSVYTDTDVYFLARWNDAEDSKLRQAWYYNETGGEWLQMGKKYPDKYGNDPAYEDKFTMFWNISIPNFEKDGCGPLCHGQYMATNDIGETADIWHWKRDRTAPVSQLDDKWLDHEQNGRHGDAGTGAYSSNVQDLVTTAGPTVKAPLYWIPGRDDYHWITQAEIDAETAKMIMDLDANGDYVDEDGTVLDKTQFGYTSPKCIPSLMGIKPGTGSRGDVSVWHNWANGEWTIKIKRARNTGTTDDLQFDTVGASYWFSVGVMNSAAIAHATPGGFAGDAFEFILAK